MKKATYLLILSILCINTMSAQKNWNDRNNSSDDNRWTLGFGVNALNNSGAQFEGLATGDHWAIAKTPFYLSADAYIDGQFSVETMVSFNYFTDGVLMDGQTILGEDEGGNDAGYFAVDLALKYSFGKLLDSNVFDPYLTVGAGLSHFGDYTTVERPLLTVAAQDIFTLNAGLGMNFWFSSNWGVNLNVAGKWGIATTYTNHIQGRLGILYKI
ncbi:hypothetical protein OAD06_02365 [Flavobacteriaceae bacterium]|nr:hypothetical protein [Flavobacteriaceae bacterium]